MRSPLLALFVRSLREDARGRAAYWTRGGLGAFLLIMLALFSQGNTWTNAPGRELFSALIVCQLIVTVVVGLGYFSSAIAEEKEEQTLGLLRMTGLDALSILLGKSTSRLCGALCLLIAQIPFTIFAVTLGGISLQQIAAAYGTVGAFVFLLCNIALLGSVLARRNAGAAVFTIVVTAFLLLLGPLLGWMPQSWRTFLGIGPGIDAVAQTLWLTTPIARLFEILSTAYRSALINSQIVSNVIAGAVFFALAWVAFERFCDRAPDAAAVNSATQRRFFGLRLARPPRPWKNALCWKDFYYLCGGHIAFCLRTVAYGCALIPFFYNSTGSFAQFGLINGFLGSVVDFVFTVDMAVMASRVFRLELRDQTLTALATVPLSIAEIAYRKAAGCLLAAAPAIFFTLAVQFMTLRQFMVLRGQPGMLPMGPMMYAKFGSSWVSTLLIVHMVAWLSLAMKRGALPLGLVITWFLQLLLSVLATTFIAVRSFAVYASGSVAMSSGAIQFIYVPAIFTGAVSILLTIFLHWNSLRRLETLAGES